MEVTFTIAMLARVGETPFLKRLCLSCIQVNQACSIRMLPELKRSHYLFSYAEVFLRMSTVITVAMAAPLMTPVSFEVL
jgi:hypothetical protein